MFKQWRINRRMSKAVELWDICGSLIRRLIEIAPDSDRELFAWEQLVWQEISMWIQLDKQVTSEELLDMAKRRGFDSTKQRFLKDILIAVGLGTHLQWLKIEDQTQVYT